MEQHNPGNSSKTRRLLMPLPLLLLVLLLSLTGCDDFSFYKELGETKEEPLSISPSALKLYVGDGSPYVFSASGGIQPYTFGILSGGGSFDAPTATYTAGPSPDAATVQVTDAVGAKREATIEVTAAVDPIVLSPASVTILPGTSVTFTVIGGSEPLDFQVTSGAALGTISPTGPREAQFDAFGTTGAVVVQVSDLYMDTDSSNITIEPYSSSVDYTLPSASATWPGGGQVPGGVCSGLFRIENSGSADGSQAVQFTVYASTDTSLGGGDAVIDSNSAGFLGAGDWIDVGYNGFWPSDPLSYYLIVAVTSADEGVPGNNTLVSPSSYSLTVDAVDYTMPSASATWPGAGVTGGDCSGSFRIDNVGSGDGTYGIEWTVYASMDTSVGSGDAVINTGSFGPLTAGDFVNTGFAGFWPPEPLSYYLIIVLSSEDDSVPGNNILISPSSYPVSVEAVDYRMNPDVWPAPGAVLTACDGSFLLENIGALDGGLPVNWIVYASPDAALGGGDHIVASGGGITRPAGLSAPVAFSGLWPAQPGDYRLIVAATAADDVNTANNTLISPATIQVSNEYPEMEPNGSWDPPVLDFGQLAAPLANDTGFVLAPGATFRINGFMETNGADIFCFNTGETATMVVAVTWAGTDTIDAYLHDGTPGLELEGGQIIDGYESFPFDIVGQGYAGSDLYLTIGNDDASGWNDQPGLDRPYLVTIACY